MKISVKVKTNARENSVTEIGERQYQVLVTASPVDGKANEAIIRLLAKYLDVPPTRLTLQRGHTSHQKIIEIS